MFKTPVRFFCMFSILSKRWPFKLNPNKRITKSSAVTNHVCTVVQGYKSVFHQKLSHSEGCVGKANFPQLNFFSDDLKYDQFCKSQRLANYSEKHLTIKVQNFNISHIFWSLRTWWIQAARSFPPTSYILLWSLWDP